MKFDLDPVFVVVFCAAAWWFYRRYEAGEAAESTATGNPLLDGIDALENALSDIVQPDALEQASEVIGDFADMSEAYDTLAEIGQ